jgi:kumamolisin
MPGADGRPIGQAAFRDITAGTNVSYPSPGKGYKALTGYDAVTGWGVPDGAKILEALKEV